MQTSEITRHPSYLSIPEGANLALPPAKFTGMAEVTLQGSKVIKAYRWEDIATKQLSPDETQVAFDLQRPATTADTITYRYLFKDADGNEYPSFLFTVFINKL